MGQIVILCRMSADSTMFISNRAVSLDEGCEDLATATLYRQREQKIS